MLHERRSYFILYGPAVQLYKRTYLAQKKYKAFNDHTLLYPESALYSIIFRTANSRSLTCPSRLHSGLHHLREGNLISDL
jgi:hypothetical protein